MASLRTLDRRLLRWRRYADKTGWAPGWERLVAYKPPPGWDRAYAARWNEWLRRHPTWPGDLRDPWWADESEAQP